MTSHATTLESIAARHNRSPLDVLELFLERAAIRQHGNMSREYAEAEAVRDVEQALAGRAA